ncbi:MAG: hypothetical protein H7226_05290, partial [Salinibacterium sp.]|nr:hypothetical protein [Salinibacterium sp.]
MTSYLPFVGFVRFPRGTHDLSSEVCPACLVERVGALCASCGLDLKSPFIVELDSSSMDVSAALDRRLELIGRIRRESAAASVLATAAEPLPVQVPSLVQVATPAVAAAVAAAPVVTTPEAPTEPRRHLGVQVVLLIVGVSLLSIGAIFFLVYAFITFGLVWRSVIILAVTVAAIVAATLLKRRKLRATAEAIAALGIVFVYLDVFAVRANDLFAAASADGLIYWGVALLLSAVGFTVWHRLSGLRLPSIVAFTTFAPGLALLVGGATAPLEDGIRVFASFAALAIGGLTHPLGRHRAEKVIVAGFGIAGLVLAGLSTPFMPGGDWIPAVELAIVAVIALAQVVLIATVGTPVAVGCAAAALGGIAAASALLSVASRISEPGFLAFWPVVGATTVALVLEIVARTRRTGLPRVLATVAAWSAGGVGVLTLLVSVGVALVPTLELTNGISTRWAVSPASTVTVPPSAAAAILALLVVVVLVSAAWAVSGTLDERLPVVLAASCAVLLLAVPLLGVLWAVVIAWLLIATAGVVALWFGRVHHWSPGIRITIMVTCLLGAALAYSASWASIDTWWLGSVGTVALLVASR